MISYAFYPTLLDSYGRFKRSEDDLSFNDLFDKINKVKSETDEQRLKGIAFESLINEMIHSGNVNCINGQFLSGDFQFDERVVLMIYEKLKRTTKIQSYQEGIIETSKGNVKLYGIFDYEFPEMTVDLKTTANYRFGKYENNMQHHFTSLITDKKEFNYVATDFEYVYIENYWLTDKTKKACMDEILDFIDFIEYYSKLITDRTIFNGRI